MGLLFNFPLEGGGKWEVALQFLFCHGAHHTEIKWVISAQSSLIMQHETT